MAQPPQCRGFTASVTELPGKGQGLRMILPGPVVLTDEPPNVTKTPQRQDLTASVTELPGKAQCLRLDICGPGHTHRRAAQPRPAPHGDQDFAEPVTELPDEGQGLRVVLPGLAILTNEPLNVAEPSPRSVDFTTSITKVSGGAKACV